MSEVVLNLHGIVRTFGQGGTVLEVLRGAKLRVKEGQIVALVGPSGSGKSTLLQISGLLEKPDGGEVSVCGEAGSAQSDKHRTRIRREKIGFVYQYHHLLPEFSALENIMIPQIIAGLSRSQARERSEKMLEWLGLSARAKHRPARLSGGEQQRVAIGRALINSPRLLLADEPTGNLDPETANGVFEILLKLVRGARLAAVIATHNPELASRMDRIVRLEDGLLIEG